MSAFISSLYGLFPVLCSPLLSCQSIFMWLFFQWTSLGFCLSLLSLLSPSSMISDLLNFFLCFLLLVSLGLPWVKLHFWNPCLVRAELVLSQLPFPPHPSLNVTEIISNSHHRCPFPGFVHPEHCKNLHQILLHPCPPLLGRCPQPHLRAFQV